MILEIIMSVLVCCCIAMTGYLISQNKILVKAYQKQVEELQTLLTRNTKVLEQLSNILGVNHK